MDDWQRIAADSAMRQGLVTVTRAEWNAKNEDIATLRAERDALRQEVADREKDLQAVSESGYAVADKLQAMRADLAAARELARVRGEAITAYVDARTVIGAEPSDYEESEPAVRAYKRLCVLAATPAPEDALVAERDALRAALESAGNTLAALSYMAHDWMGMGTLEQYKGMVDVNTRKAHEAYERVMAALGTVA